MPDRPVFFKATRVDGTDFRTGRVQYEAGKRVRPLPLAPGAIRSICGPGYLHAADVASETLIGGHWPCRLFEVTGTPATGFDSFHRHKGAFRELRVLREIPAHLALGPNGEAVAEVIERSKRISFEEAMAFRASRDASRAASWAASRDASRAASRDASRDASWAASWDASWDASWAASRDASRAASRDASRDASWAATWAATWAAVAVHSRDLITPERFDYLYGPWAKVIDSKDGTQR